MKLVFRGVYVLLPACLLAGCAGGPNGWKMPFTAKKQDTDRAHHATSELRSGVRQGAQLGIDGRTG